MQNLQQNTHGLVQLIRAATPNQSPMPQLSKQMFNVCPIAPMYTLVTRDVRRDFHGGD